MTLIPSSSWLSASEVCVKNTAAPPAGAGALNVTVAVAVVRPATVVGVTVSPANTGPASGGDTFNRMNCVLPPYEAVMVTAVVAVTELVVTGKRTATASAGTVTL